MIFKSVNESGKTIVLSELACRKLFLFMAGDLPLFAFEYWLKGSDAKDALPRRLYEALITLDFDSDEIHQEAIARVQPYGADGLFETWHLLELLPWIVNRDPRATKSMTRCLFYYEQGLSFLWPIADAFREGRLEMGGFDWAPVEQNAKELDSVTRFIIQGIEAKAIRISDQGHFDMNDDYAQFLDEACKPNADWKQTNQRLFTYLNNPLEEELS